MKECPSVGVWIGNANYRIPDPRELTLLGVHGGRVLIQCDEDAAEWIASRLPSSDRFTKDIYDALLTQYPPDTENSQ